MDWPGLPGFLPPFRIPHARQKVVSLLVQVASDTGTPHLPHLPTPPALPSTLMLNLPLSQRCVWGLSSPPHLLPPPQVTNSDVKRGGPRCPADL